MVGGGRWYLLTQKQSIVGEVEGALAGQVAAALLPHHHLPLGSLEDLLSREQALAFVNLPRQYNNIY
jgi:hypothetical protein